MTPVYLLLVGLWAAVSLCSGCSPPAPGTPSPTMGERVGWADILAVGTVKTIIADPAQNSWASTYGAKVEIQCTYKGGPLPGLITIGNAGYIPGHCTDMALTAGDKVILLLDTPRASDDYYTQTDLATVYTRTAIAEYLQVCGLDMRYPVAQLPEGGTMALRRKVCDHVTSLDTCMGDIKTVSTEKAVEVKQGRSGMTDTDDKAMPAEGRTDTSKTGDGDNSAGTTCVSFTALMMTVIVAVLF